MRCRPHALLSGLLLLGAASCSGPDLEPWHTERLTTEFTAKKADDVEKFEDYLRLEEALLAELNEKVVSRTEVGAPYMLYRFSAGSAADPQQRDPNWNRSFELDADAPVGGVLLVHGMSDAPYSLRVLGETLHRRGYSVVGLRLPGHGTAPSGLKYISVEDLVAAVRLGAAHLTSKVGDRPIHIVGYSTGAALALDYTLDALERGDSTVPASLVLVSPAIGLQPAAALAGVKNTLALVPGLERDFHGRGTPRRSKGGRRGRAGFGRVVRVRLREECLAGRQ